MQRLSDHSSRGSSGNRLSSLFNKSRSSGHLSNGLIATEFAESCSNPTFCADTSLAASKNVNVTKDSFDHAPVTTKPIVFEEPVKPEYQVEQPVSCLSRRRKMIIASMITLIVIVAAVLGGVLSMTSKSPVAISDTTNKLETSLFLLTNTGSSDADIKKSSGDHLETTIHLTNGDITFIFDKVPDADGSVGTLEIIGNVTIEQDDLDTINTELAELEDITFTNPRANFAITVLTYLSRATAGHIIESRTIPLNMQQSTGGDSPGDGSRRFRELQQCADSFLSTWATPPYSGVACPTYTSKPVGDSGATCLCPYQGTTPREALYDAIRPSDQATVKVSWFVKYGSATSDCLGRCGAGCNSLDKEAFQDCLDHDVCLSHVGGSLFSDNPSCGNEFNQAADDYVVSYGWGCC